MEVFTTLMVQNINNEAISRALILRSYVRIKEEQTDKHCIIVHFQVQGPHSICAQGPQMPNIAPDFTFYLQICHREFEVSGLSLDALMLAH